MKDSQYFSAQQKTWNGGVMSGAGGGGRREDGGRGGGSYPPWPPAHHPIHSHHHMPPSPPSSLPRMMGGYFGGRGVPPASAYTGGGWSRPSGLKPPERWAPVVGSSTAGGQQAEDLSQSSRPNGSQPNGVTKEPVSVIAANPLRTGSSSGGDKPLDPSDRSDDEDEDCMVIEEGEEAPRTGELPPHRPPLPVRHLSEPGGQLQAVPSIGLEAPSLEAPPAHHNPPAIVRQEAASHHPPARPEQRPEPSHYLPPRQEPSSHHHVQRMEPSHHPPPPQKQDSTRPDVSHHLPPSVAQPLHGLQQQALHRIAQHMLLQKLKEPGLQKLPQQSAFQARQDTESVSMPTSRPPPPEQLKEDHPLQISTPPLASKPAQDEEKQPAVSQFSSSTVQRHHNPPQQQDSVQIPFQSRVESASVPQASPRLELPSHQISSRQEDLELGPDIASLPPQLALARPAESAAGMSNNQASSPQNQLVQESDVPNPSVPLLPPLQANESPFEEMESLVKKEDNMPPESVDHVESMLENMFQQDDTPFPSAPPISVSERRSPELTEDRVVEILQDSDSPVKQEIKDEIKAEPSTPALPPKNNDFMQVESELEKMFAGIVETPGDSDKPETPESSKSSKRSSVKRKVRRPKTKKRDSLDSGKKQRNRSPNEFVKLKRRMGGPKVLKEGSNDSSIISVYKSKGPLIRVSKDKDGRPATVTIVNSSSAEEDRDRSMDIKIKRKTPRIVEGRIKGPGLFSSTLSSKYNSNTIDVTWTCIFCNRRSHCENGLGGEPSGDLFGPYLVHIKTDPSYSLYCVAGPSDADVASEQRKRGGGKQLSLRAGGQANHSFSPPSKKSRKLSGSDKDGIGGSGENIGTATQEVWVHEACAVWSPGVILVGPHLIGLDDAVSLSINSKCSVCGENGACIPCLQHGCPRVCHYGCAKATQWSLDEETFHARCLNHKKPITLSLALHQNST